MALNLARTAERRFLANVMAARLYDVLPAEAQTPDLHARMHDVVAEWLWRAVDMTVTVNADKSVSVSEPNDG